MFKRKINYIPLFILLFFIVTSCKNKDEDKATYWGKTMYYSDFLWKKYEPTQMTRKIHFDFNEDASTLQNIKFGIFKKENGNYTFPLEDIQLFKNGQLCLENVFSVNGDETEADITIVFKPNAPKGLHKWYIKLIDNTGLDRINDQSINKYNAPIALEWFAKKEHVWNPLAFLLTGIIISIVILFLIWNLILKKMFYPTFQVSSIIISSPYFFNTKLKNYRKIVFTNRRKKQSLFNRIFTGKVIYSVNSVWTSPCEFIPRDKKSIRMISKDYIINSSTTVLQQGTNYTIININNKSEQITLLIN